MSENQGERVDTLQSRHFGEPAETEIVRLTTREERESGLDLGQVPTRAFLRYLMGWVNKLRGKYHNRSLYGAVVERLGVPEKLYKGWVEKGTDELHRIVTKEGAARSGGWASCRVVAKLELEAKGDLYNFKADLMNRAVAGNEVNHTALRLLLGGADGIEAMQAQTDRFIQVQLIVPGLTAETAKKVIERNRNPEEEGSVIEVLANEPKN